MGSFVVASFFAYSAGSRPTQGKPEARKTLANLENNVDNFNFSGPISLQKETTATRKERENLLLEMKAKAYYGFKTMTRKLKRYVQVKAF